MQAQFKESFDFATSPIEELGDVNKTANAWNLKVPPWQATLRVKPDYAPSDVLPPFIASGSLQYKDAAGAPYPSTGNRLVNPTDSKYRLTLGHHFDLKNSSFASELLEASSDPGQNPERSRPGWGAPNQTLWFSVLLKTSTGTVSLVFRNIAYSTGANGLSLACSPDSGLTVSQDWPSLRDENEAKGEVSVSSDTPVWVVGRLQTGPEWGNSAAYEKFNPSSPRDAERPKPTGKLTLWTNPLIKGAPEESNAALQIPLYEFRINALSLDLEPEAEVDEVRVGTSFDELVQ